MWWNNLNSRSTYYLFRHTYCTQGKERTPLFKLTTWCKLKRHTGIVIYFHDLGIFWFWNHAEKQNIMNPYKEENLRDQHPLWTHLWTKLLLEIQYTIIKLLQVQQRYMYKKTGKFSWPLQCRCTNEECAHCSQTNMKSASNLTTEPCDTHVIKASHPVKKNRTFTSVCLSTASIYNKSQNTARARCYCSKVQLWESKLVWSVHLLGAQFLLSQGWQSRLMVASNTSWRPSFLWLSAPLCSSLLVASARWRVRFAFCLSNGQIEIRFIVSGQRWLAASIVGPALITT